MDAALRDVVRRRAGNRCEYCLLPQQVAPFLSFHIEHITAQQHGGNDSPLNLALACPDCNRFKGPNLTSIDPQTNEVVSLFNPRIHRWYEHFKVEGSKIVGRTAVGRATVCLLNMNERGRQDVRGELQARGEM